MAANDGVIAHPYIGIGAPINYSEPPSSSYNESSSDSDNPETLFNNLQHFSATGIEINPGLRLDQFLGEFSNFEGCMVLEDPDRFSVFSLVDFAGIAKSSKFPITFKV